MGILDLFNKDKPPAAQAPALPKPKVLVIDDDQFLREFYIELLTGEGYQLSSAEDGKIGLEKAAQLLPDVILLDIMMPVMDGNEVLRQLWNNTHLKSIPVIILTNAGNLNNMENAKFYSAYKFLIKSNVKPEEVTAAVKEALIKNYNWDSPKYYLDTEKKYS